MSWKCISGSCLVVVQVLGKRVCFHAVFTPPKTHGSWGAVFTFIFTRKRWCPIFPNHGCENGVTPSFPMTSPRSNRGEPPNAPPERQTARRLLWCRRTPQRRHNHPGSPLFAPERGGVRSPYRRKNSTPQRCIAQIQVLKMQNLRNYLH